VEITTAELTILGLVAEQPRHGYELEKVIERRGIRQWTDIGFSSIYYLLSKLEKRGLVIGATPEGGPKSRRVFEVTAEGRRAVAEQALALVAKAQPVHHPVLVGLANLPLLPEGQYAAAIRERLIRVQGRIDGVRAAQQAQEPLPLPAREVFSYSLSLLEAERAWLASRAHQVSDGSQE